MATNRTSETEINKHKDVECKMEEEQQVESQQYRESNNVSRAREEEAAPTTVTIVKQQQRQRRQRKKHVHWFFKCIARIILFFGCNLLLQRIQIKQWLGELINLVGAGAGAGAVVMSL